MSVEDRFLVATAVYFVATIFFSICAYYRGKKDQRTATYCNGKFCVDCEKPLDNEMCAECRIEYWRQHHEGN
jgi:hypothetical protein